MRAIPRKCFVRATIGFVAVSIFVWPALSADINSAAARQDAEALVRNWANAVNSGNGLAGIDQYLAEDYIWHLPGENVRGREAVKKIFSEMFQKCPQFKTEAEHIIVEGEWVVVRWSETCSPGASSTTDITIDRFGGGRFLEGWEIDAEKPWVR